MIFDTDILIWIQRGNLKAVKLLENTEDRNISVITYMELLQSALNKKQHLIIKDFISSQDFTIIPLSENIGHRASIYIEEYSLGFGVAANDALIAATAIENNQVLSSGNHKHFKAINDLQFQVFKP